MKKSKDKVKKPEPAKTETTTRGEVYDWMQSLVFALIICILVFVFLFLGIAGGAKSVYDLTKRFYARDLERENIEQQYYKNLYKARADRLSGRDSDSEDEP